MQTETTKTRAKVITIPKPLCTCGHAHSEHVHVKRNPGCLHCGCIAYATSRYRYFTEAEVAEETKHIFYRLGLPAGDKPMTRAAVMEACKREQAAARPEILRRTIEANQRDLKSAEISMEVSSLRIQDAERELAALESPMAERMAA